MKKSASISLFFLLALAAIAGAEDSGVLALIAGLMVLLGAGAALATRRR